jgi:hypothetical protein
MIAMDARRRAIIFEIPATPPFPKKFIIRSALTNETQTMKRLSMNETIVGITP